MKVIFETDHDSNMRSSFKSIADNLEGEESKSLINLIGHDFRKDKSIQKLPAISSLNLRDNDGISKHEDMLS